MTFVDKVNDLQSKKQKLELGGGQERIDQQHKKTNHRAYKQALMKVHLLKWAHLPRLTVLNLIYKRKSPETASLRLQCHQRKTRFAAAEDFTVIGGSLERCTRKRLSML